MPERLWAWLRTERAASAAMVLAALFAGSALTHAMVVSQPLISPIASVVKTTPADGAVIPAGEFTLTVLFDRPMRPGGWSFVRLPDAAFPDCDNKPVQSKDRRSFTMQCKAAARTAYAMSFNGGTFRNFRSDEGWIPAAPKRITFRAE